MKKTILIVSLFMVIILFGGCTSAERVAANISKEADLFNVTRRLAVLNMRSDRPIFEMVGNFSIANNASKELAITVQTGPGQYKKHFIYLNQWTMYVVEDISGANVSPYKYEINFIPEAFMPITFTNDY